MCAIFLLVMISCNKNESGHDRKDSDDSETDSVIFPYGPAEDFDIVIVDAKEGKAVEAELSIYSILDDNNAVSNLTGASEYTVHLSPGTYHVYLSYCGYGEWYENITFSEDSDRATVFKLDVGELLVSVYAYTNGEPFKSPLTIYKHDDHDKELNEYVNSNRYVINLPEGVYDIEAEMDYGSVWYENISITAGKTTPQTLFLNGGEIRVHTASKAYDIPVEASVYFYISGEHEDWILVKLNASDLNALLTEGEYDLKATSGDIEKWVENLSVIAGEVINVNVEL